VHRINHGVVSAAGEPGTCKPGRVAVMRKTMPATKYGEFPNDFRGPYLSAIEIPLVSAMFAPKAGIG
jgi:hypothetical protein